MEIGICIILASMLLVVAEALASYYWSKNFFPSQVIARWGKTGIAFFAHGGMWGDIFLLPALFSFIIIRYSKTWSAKQIVIMGLVGFAVTLGNHLNLIRNQSIPDPLGWQKEKWSVPIALHFVYMTMYVALAGLFYFSPGVSTGAAIAVSAILGIHMAFGTHIPLGLLNLWKQWPWCPTSFLHARALRMQVGIWVALTIFSWIAAGWQAGLSVATIGVCGAGLVSLLVQMSPTPRTRHSR